MAETKHAKFLRLSAARMEKVEFAMKQLSYLTSHNYEFSEEEAAALISRLRAQVDDLAGHFGVQEEVPLPEPVAPPPPPPPPASDAPRVMAQGPLDLNSEESRHLIRVGPQLGAAINALEDDKPSEAYDLLLNLMRS